MSGGSPAPAPHGGGRHSEWPPRLVAVPPGGAERDDVLRVVVTGPDAAQRRRLAELLAEVAGVEVVASEPARSLSVCAEAPGRPDVAPPTGLTRPRLTDRQREVLVAYAAGSELLGVVARRLGMNPETLKTHVRRIRAKYQQAGRPAPTRRDLYVRAVQDGLVPPPS